MIAVKVLLAVAVVVPMVACNSPSPPAPSLTASPIPAATATASPSATHGQDVPLALNVAINLDVPWALDFLPDGSMIFTERAGRIRLIDAERALVPAPLLTLDDVAVVGEGGLLGLAVHPRFVVNGFLYVYYTYRQGNGVANRVVRFRKQGAELTDRKTIIEGIPGGVIHDGGRLKFGFDGMLYVTTGDSGVGNLAQDRDSLAGKILRLKDDGTIPVDNPFAGSPVYSYGHRNPQGLAWDSQGRLWEAEHGQSATDELNLIEPGKNYGWPVIRGDEKAPGMESPVVHSGATTWAPSGLAFFDGSLFFCGLRGQSLFEVRLGGQPVTVLGHLRNQFGRLRDVVAGPDGLIYVLTNNRDGRGTLGAGDDRIIRINPEKF